MDARLEVTGEETDQVEVEVNLVDAEVVDEAEEAGDNISHG